MQEVINNQIPFFKFMFFNREIVNRVIGQLRLEVDDVRSNIKFILENFLIIQYKIVSIRLSN